MSLYGPSMLRDDSIVDSNFFLFLFETALFVIDFSIDILRRLYLFSFVFLIFISLPLLLIDEYVLVFMERLYRFATDKVFGVRLLLDLVIIFFAEFLAIVILADSIRS